MMRYGVCVRDSVGVLRAGQQEHTLLAYLDHYGLVSGSFDLALDSHGGYWWLELNPNGQWGWLEEKTGLEMSAAFADLLTEGDAT